MKVVLLVSGAFALLLLNTISECSPLSESHGARVKRLFDFNNNNLAQGFQFPGFGNSNDGTKNNFPQFGNTGLNFPSFGFSTNSNNNFGDQILIQGFLSLINQVIDTMGNSLKNIPGGSASSVVLRGIVLPQSPLKDANEALILLTKLVGAINELFIRGTPQQITYVINGNNGLTNTLPQIKLSFNQLTFDSSKMQSLLTVIKVDNINKLFAVLNELRQNIQTKSKATFGNIVLGEIDQIIGSIGKFGVEPYQSPLVKVAIALFNLLKNIPGDIPELSTIPTAEALTKSDTKEVLSTITKLMDILVSIFRGKNLFQANSISLGFNNFRNVMSQLAYAIQYLIFDLYQVNSLGSASISILRDLQNALNSLKTSLSMTLLIADKQFIISEIDRSVFLLSHLTILLGPSNWNHLSVYLMDSLSNIPGGLPAHVILPDISKLADAKIKDAFDINIKLVDAMNAIFKVGKEEQIKFLLTEKYGLYVTLPQMIEFLEKLAIKTRDINAQLNIEAVNQFSLCLNTLKANIDAVAAKLNVDYNVMMNRALSLTDILNLMLNPNQWSPIAVAFFQLLNTVPNGIPEGIILPDTTGLAKANVKEGIIAIIKQLNCINSVFKLGTEEQIKHLWNKETGLPIIVKRMKVFLRLTGFDADYSKNIKTYLTVQLIDELFTALITLKTNIETKGIEPDKAALILIMDDSITLLNVISYILNPKQLHTAIISIIKLIYTLPGDVPRDIIFPDTSSLRNGQLKDVFIMLEKMTSFINDILKINNNKQTNYILTGDLGLKIVIPHIKKFLNFILSDQQLLKDIPNSLSFRIIRQLSSSLLLIKPYVPDLAVVLDDCFTTLNKIINVLIVSLGDSISNDVEYQDKIGVPSNDNQSGIQSLTSLLKNTPGGLPAGITLPIGISVADGTIENSIKILILQFSAINDVFRLGSNEQIKFIIANNLGLISKLPDVTDFLRTLVFDSNNIANVTPTLSLDIMNKLINEIVKLKENIQMKTDTLAPQEVLAMIDNILSLNDIIIVIIKHQKWSGFAVHLYLILYNLPGSLPPKHNIPDISGLKTDHLKDTLLVTIKFINTLNDIFDVATKEQISYLISTNPELKNAIINLKEYLETLVSDAAEFINLHDDLQIDIIRDITIALTKLKDNIIKHSTASDIVFAINRIVSLSDIISFKVGPKKSDEVAITLLKWLIQLPGGLSDGFTVIENSVLSNGDLKSIIISITRILNSVNRLFETGSKEEIVSLLKDQKILIVTLNFIEDFLQSFRRDHEEIKKYGLSIENLQHLTSELSKFDSHINEINDVAYLNKIIHRLIALSNIVVHTISPNKLHNAVISLLGLLLSAPQDLQTGIDIPDTAALGSSNIDYTVILLSKLIHTTSGILKTNVDKQKDYVFGLNDLGTTVPEIEIFLQLLAFDSEMRKDLSVYLTVDIIKELSSSLVNFKRNIPDSKIVKLIDRNLAIVEVIHFVVHPYKESEALIDLASLLIRIPGNNGNIPDISGLSQSNIAKLISFSLKLLDALNGVFVNGTDDEIRFIVNDVSGFRTTITKLNKFFESTALNRDFLQDLIGLSSNSEIEEIYASLTRLKTNIETKTSPKDAVILNAIIVRTFTALDLLALKLNPNQSASGLTAFISTLIRLPGNLPPQISIPDTSNLINGNIFDTTVTLNKLIETLNNVFKFGTPEQIQFLVTDKTALILTINNIKVLFKTLSTDKTDQNKLESIFIQEAMNTIRQLILLTSNISKHENVDVIINDIRIIASLVDVIIHTIKPNKIGDASISIISLLNKLLDIFPEVIRFPEISIISDGDIKGELIKLTTLIQTIYKLINAGTKEQVNFLLVDKMAVILTKVKEVMHDLAFESKYAADLSTNLTTEIARNFYESLIKLKVAIRDKSSSIDSKRLIGQLNDIASIVDVIKFTLEPNETDKTAISIIELINRIPGDLPDTFESPDNSIISNGDLTHTIINLRVLLNIINVILNSGNEEQIHFIVTNKTALQEILFKIKTLLHMIAFDTKYINDLPQKLTIEVITQLKTTLINLRNSIKKLSNIPQASDLVAFMNSYISIIDVIVFHIKPNETDQTSIAFVSVLNKIPGKLPEGVDLPDASVLSHGDIKETFHSLTNLVHTFDKILNLGTDEQFRYLVSDKTALSLILPKIKETLHAFAFETRFSSDLKTKLAPKVVKDFYQSLTNLKLVIKAKSQSSDASTLIHILNDASTIVDVITFTLEPNETDKASVSIIEFLHKIPGPLPEKLILPGNSIISKGDFKNTLVTLFDLIDAVNVILTSGNEEQIHFIITDKKTLPDIILNIKILLQSFAFDSKYEDNFSTNLSTDVVEHLRKSLLNLRTNIHNLINFPEATSLVSLINSFVSIIDVFAFHIQPNKLDETSVSFVTLLNRIPDKLPQDVVLPDTTVLSGGNVKETVISMTNLINAFDKIIDLGTEEQIKYLITDKRALTLTLPKIKETLNAFAFQTSVTSDWKTKLAPEVVRHFYESLNTLKLVIKHKSPTPDDYYLVNILKDVSTVVDIISFSLEPNETDKAAVSIIEFLHLIPGTLPEKMILPDTSIISGGDLENTVITLAELIEVVNLILNSGNEEQIHFTITDKKALPDIITNIKILLHSFAFNSIYINDFPKHLSTKVIEHLRSSLLNLRMSIQRSSNLAESSSLVSFINSYISIIDVIVYHIHPNKLDDSLVSFISLLNKIPDKLPKEIILPDTTFLSGGDTKKTVLSLTNLVKIFAKIIDLGTEEQIQYLLTDETALKVSLNKMVETLRVFAFGPTYASDFKASLSPEVVGNLYESLHKLKLVLKGKSSSSDDSHLIHVLINACIIVDVITFTLEPNETDNTVVSIIKLLNNIPGPLSGKINLPDTTIISKGDIKNTVVNLVELIDIINEVIKSANEEQIHFIFTDKAAIREIISDIKRLLNLLVFDSDYVKILPTNATKDIIEKLRTSLMNLGSTIKTLSKIPETSELLLFINSYVSIIDVIIHYIEPNKADEPVVSLIILLNKIPGILPEGVALPESSVLSNGNVKELIITLTNLVKIIDEIARTGNTEQTDYLLYDKSALLLAVPKLKEIVLTLAFDTIYKTKDLPVDVLTHFSNSLSRLILSLVSKTDSHDTLQVIAVLKNIVTVVDVIIYGINPNQIDEANISILTILNKLPVFNKELIISDKSVLSNGDVAIALNNLSSLISVINKVLIIGNPEQVSHLIDNNSGLIEILGNIKYLLRLLAFNSSYIEKLPKILTEEVLNDLTCAMENLKINIPATEVLIIEIINDDIKIVEVILFDINTSESTKALAFVIGLVNSIPVTTAKNLILPDISVVTDGKIENILTALVTMLQHANEMLIHGDSNQIDFLTSDKSLLETLPIVNKLIFSLAFKDENVYEDFSILPIHVIEEFLIVLHNLKNNIHTTITSQNKPGLMEIVIKMISNINIVYLKLNSDKWNGAAKEFVHKLISLPTTVAEDFLLPDIYDLVAHDNSSGKFKTLGLFINTISHILKLGDKCETIRI